MGRPRYAAILDNVGRSPEVLRCIRISPDWITLVSTYLGFRRLSLPNRFRTRSGDTIVLESFHDLVTAWIIYCRREYTVRPEDRVIVDAGANIGVFTLYAARRAPHSRLVAIEPFQSTRERLEQTIASNGLVNRVKVTELALARSDSLRLMYDKEAPSQLRGMLPSDATDGVSVEAVSLETLLDREGLRDVDLLKMDIEGAEHEVLAGASPTALARIRRISLEYHPNGSKEELFRALTDAGFRLDRDTPVSENSGVAELSRRAVPERSRQY
jgi:FkbM family methyltransferase